MAKYENEEGENSEDESAEYTGADLSYKISTKSIRVSLIYYRLANKLKAITGIMPEKLISL